MEHLQQNSRLLQEKWAPVLNHEGLPEISDKYKRAVTAVLLENQEKAIQEQALVEGGHSTGLLQETTVNTGSATNGESPGFGSSAAANTAKRAGYDPILISLVRRSTPQLIAYDIVGTQPMSGPTGLVFFMKSNYVSQGDNSASKATGNEALFDEASTQFSGRPNTVDAMGSGDAGAGDQAADPFSAAYYDDNAVASGNSSSGNTGTGMTTNTAETLGTGSAHFREMTFGIEKTSVTARSRALKAEYTTELVQDLKAIHGLDAEQELSNILSTEILQEINREVVRTVNGVAVIGAEATATPGIFDCDVDASGRWSVEKFKGLHFQLEREANQIAVKTRRGRGNIIIASADVIAALSMTGTLDTGAAAQLADDGLVNNTFVGTLNGKFKVYVDPYYTSVSTQLTDTDSGALNAVHEYITIGYKGSSAYDAGVFYCPYVPLQKVSAVGEDTFQPKIGFKTRYGMLANPFEATGLDAASGAAGSRIGNNYYRKFAITNIL
tara:strand:+ start:8645 stop:10135 length:1491 start_codon:yes stop_codon:yes gene_type:complete